MHTHHGNSGAASEAKSRAVRIELGAIVAALGGELHGDPHTVITAIASLETANATQLSFLSDKKYQHFLPQSQAACVIVAPAMRDAALQRGSCIVSPNPYLYYARCTQLYKRLRDGVPVPSIHPSAVVDASAVVDPSATVGALCVVGARACIGAHTVLSSRVTVGADCRIGAHCVVHDGVVIGADGFGFAKDGDRWEKIEQLGAVRIGDWVEIGANTCIDRGALQDTVLEDGVKLDNLVQIAHGVHVGRNTAMAGCVGVAGSAKIGANCSVGGGAIILGHLEVADGVTISAATVVTESIEKAGQYTGVFPIDEHKQWIRNSANLKQLHSLRHRVLGLEGKLLNHASGSHAPDSHTPKP